MRRNFTRLFFDEDTGGGGGSATGTTPPDPIDPQGTEGTSKQLAAEKAAREAAEKELADLKKAQMTEEQRRQAELDDARSSLLAEHEMLQLKTLGVAEEFKPLLTGATAEEIKQHADLLAKLISSVKEETEAKVKKEVAKTGAPGGRQDHDDDEGEMSPADFYRLVLNGGTKR